MADSPDDLGSASVLATDDTDRLRGLIAAHRLITSDSDLSAMLNRIVRAACDLVGTSYGVLGLLSTEGNLERSVQHGKLAGPTATRTVLEVPIRVGSTVLGNLFLAEPRAGRFSHADEELVGALAAVAGAAVNDARLHDDARRSSEWLTASGEIARTLLHGGDDILPQVLQRAVDIADGEYGALIIPTEDGRLSVMHTVGVGAAQFRGLVFTPEESGIGRSIMTGESLVISDMVAYSRAGFVNTYDYGPAMLIPMVDARGVRGAILIIRTRKRRPFEPREVEVASLYGAQVALALQFDDSRAQREQLRALEVRHGIAQVLHDDVIQRLFAIGVGLQSVAQAGLEQDIESRLARHINDLDETIDEIRNRVFGLSDVIDTDADHSRFPHLPRGASAAEDIGGVAAEPPQP